MNIVLIVVGAVFTLAAALMVWRIAVGPSVLDRVIASDVLLSEVLCVLCVDMVLRHQTDTLPVVLVIAAVGVFGSLGVVRFVVQKEGKNRGS